MTQIDKSIKQKIISLPFEPIPHCMCFTKDDKYIFVAMWASVQIITELNEELKEEHGNDPETIDYNNS